MEGLVRDQKQVEEESMRAQAQLWKYIYGYANSLTLKCALKLGIPDVIDKHNGPMTLHELADSLQLESVNVDRLFRLMRYLVHMKLFVITADEDGEKYGLTPASKLLVKGEEVCLASYAWLQLGPDVFSIWQHLIDGFNVSTTPWVACFGESCYETLVEDLENRKLFNNAMMDYSICVIPAFLRGCINEGLLEGVKSLVDVGGNSGVVSKAIVNAFQHVKCTVLDLPHIIESVPQDPKLNFVAGDMFAFVPNADAVLMKSTLHNFDDEDCVKILNKCKEAINSTRGKVILVEIVVDTENVPELSSARLCMDMEMMMMGGKERTKEQWENLLNKAGFSHHKIIPIMAMESIIVAYP